MTTPREVREMSGGELIALLKAAESHAEADPFATELLRRLVEAERVKKCLEELLDLQNGPPLLKYEKQWTAVVNTAEILLGRRATEPEEKKDDNPNS